MEGQRQVSLVRPVVILHTECPTIREVLQDGRELEAGLDYRLGELRRLDGRRLILWLNLESERKTALELRR